MTLGLALAFLVFALSSAAGAARSRDGVLALLSVGSIAALGVRTLRGGLDTARLVAHADELLVILGLLSGALAVGVTAALPRRLEDRLVYGRAFRERAFDRALLAARRPFAEAAAADDTSVFEKARWRDRIASPPPDAAWDALADRLAEGDEAWVDNVRAGATRDQWVPWQSRNDQVLAEWEHLRQRARERSINRARTVGRLARVGYVASAALVVVGMANLTSAVLPRPPAERAAVVPPAPPGRSVYFAPLGDFPPADLAQLAAFYEARYGLHVEVLPTAPIPKSARVPGGGQVVAEALIDVIRGTYAEAADPERVVIGFTAEDLRIQARPDWGWAFGWRDESLAVLSRSRMQPRLPVPGELEATRLRKMTTKYIGVLYFGLSESGDPRSVLYGRILGVSDLDAMGEDY